MNKQLNVISGGIYDAIIDSTDEKYLESRIPALGQVVEFDDGRKFRYVSSEADLTVGSVVAMATCLATALDNSCTAAAAGSLTVTIATTGSAFFGGSAGVLAANRLAEGYLVISDGAGAGYSYKIKSHTAGTSAVSVTFTLYDPLVVAITTASDVFFVGPKYRKVVEGTATLKAIGSCMRAVTGTTDTKEYFFWAQTKGPACVEGTSTVGVPVACAASGAVADTAEAGSGAYDQVVGVALVTSSDAYTVVDLMLD